MFGLHVRSHIEHPSFVRALVLERPHGDVPDVTVAYGPVAPGAGPPDLAAIEVNSPDHTLLTLPRLARVAVRDGTSITVEALEASDAEGIALCAFGKAFAYLLLQRGLVPLHASAFQVDGQVVALLAHSGRGKSTTATALHERGHAVIADDLVAVSLGGPQPLVHGQDLAHLKVWIESAPELALDCADTTPLRQGVQRLSKPRRAVSAGIAPLAACLVLDFDDQLAGPVIEPLSPLQAVVAVRPHIFGHRQVIEVLGKRWLLGCQTGLAEGCRFARLVRPRGLAGIDACLDAIEDSLPMLTGS